MAFKIKTEPEAHLDIQEGIDWYNKQQSGLGRKFHSEVKAYFKNGRRERLPRNVLSVHIPC